MGVVRVPRGLGQCPGRRIVAGGAGGNTVGPRERQVMVVVAGREGMMVGDQVDVMTVIPLVDLRAAHAQVAAEIQAGFDDVISSTAFIKGDVAAAFERDYAAFTGVAHCVGVANGTDALELALRAAEVPAGAEVIMPANTFVATAEAVVRAGARPAFADVDPDYLLLDPGAWRRP